MGYASSSYFAYGLNLGDQMKAGRTQDHYWSESLSEYSGKDEIGYQTKFESLIEAEYPALEVDFAGDSRMQQVVILAAEGSISASSPEFEADGVSDEAKAQLEFFCERFDIVESPAWISYEFIA